MVQPDDPTHGYTGSVPENYERYFVPTIGAPSAHVLVNALALQPGERVLDAACGTGIVARLAAREVGEQGSVAGVDMNPGMLAVARACRENAASIEWYETPMEAMPLEDASFDVVLCQYGIQFSSDKGRALRELRRVLRPGGRIAWTVPGPMPELFGELAGALGRHIDPTCSGFVKAVFSLHDPDELRRSMSEAGFEQTTLEGTRLVLRLPPPADFLGQYISSTPLAEPVAKADPEQRRALWADLRRRWDRFAIDGDLRLEVRVTLVRAP